MRTTKTQLFPAFNEVYKINKVELIEKQQEGTMKHIWNFPHSSLLPEFLPAFNEISIKNAVFPQAAFYEALFALLGRWTFAKLKRLHPASSAFNNTLCSVPTNHKFAEENVLNCSRGTEKAWHLSCSFCEHQVEHEICRCHGDVTCLQYTWKNFPTTDCLHFPAELWVLCSFCKHWLHQQHDKSGVSVYKMLKNMSLIICDSTAVHLTFHAVDKGSLYALLLRAIHDYWGVLWKRILIAWKIWIISTLKQELSWLIWSS